MAAPQPDDSPPSKKRKAAARKLPGTSTDDPNPNINFRAGDYWPLIHKARESGEYDSVADILKKGLWLIFHGPHSGQWNPDLMNRLRCLAEALQCSVPDIVERLLNEHGETLRREASRRKKPEARVDDRD